MLGSLPVSLLSMPSKMMPAALDWVLGELRRSSSPMTETGSPVLDVFGELEAQLVSINIATIEIIRFSIIHLLQVFLGLLAFGI